MQIRRTQKQQSESLRRPAAIALVVAMIAILSSALGCRSMVIADSSGNRLTRGSTAVTLVNLHAHKKTLSSVNRQGSELIPVCTQVQITELGSKRMSFRTSSSPQSYSFRYHKAAAEPFAQNLARYFGSRCPGEQIASMSALDQHGIQQGRPYIGMTRQGIILAMGYPPKHRTPSLAATSWRYWGRKARASSSPCRAWMPPRSSRPRTWQRRSGTPPAGPRAPGDTALRHPSPSTPSRRIHRPRRRPHNAVPLGRSPRQAASCTPSAWR
jgi:hypothetical protein